MTKYETLKKKRDKIILKLKKIYAEEEKLYNLVQSLNDLMEKEIGEQR